MERLHNLDQAVTIPTAGTYRYQYDYLCSYVEGDEPYLNFQFGAEHMQQVPPSGVPQHYSHDFVFVGGEKPSAHFHASSDTSIGLWSVYIDNVSLKKIG